LTKTKQILRSKVVELSSMMKYHVVSLGQQ